MKARAVECFESQTYQNRELVIYEGPRGQPIGTSRNIANAKSHGSILCHWDEDDWSHTGRISEQVSLLLSADVDLVGINECLFWDTRHLAIDRQFQAGAENKNPVTGLYPPTICGEAWLYRYPNPAYCLGSSFLYWRKTWQRQPFDDVNHGEDERFRLKVKSVGISSLPVPGDRHCYDPGVVWIGECGECGEPEGSPNHDGQPRMICAIHGGNTSHYAPERDRAMWRRAENWDSTCERMMKL